MEGGKNDALGGCSLTNRGWRTSSAVPTNLAASPQTTSDCTTPITTRSSLLLPVSLEEGHCDAEDDECRLLHLTLEDQHNCITVRGTVEEEGEDTWVRATPHRRCAHWL